MNKKEFLESGLLEQYMLGLLDDQEDIKRIEGYIEKDRDIKLYYDRIQQDMLSLADANSIAPPPSVKKQIMKDIRSSEDSVLSNSNLMNYLPWLLSAILGALIFIGFIRYNKVADRLVSTQNAYTVLVEECTKQEADMNSKALFFADINTIKVSIDKGGFQMSAFYNKEKSLLAIEGFKSGDLPKEKCYYLWGDVNNEMIKIGRLDDSQMKEFASFDPNMVSLNVTIEDASIEVDHPDVSQLVGSVAI